MTVYLIRHGHAGSRAAWAGDDRTRPLSAKGRTQADQLADRLQRASIARVASSPYARCVQTVEPIAERAGLTVESTTALAEGADPESVATWLLSGADDGLVACSHGDVIPKVLRLLLADGLRAEVGAMSQKGSLWVLETEGGRFRTGTYQPPAKPA